MQAELDAEHAAAVEQLRQEMSAFGAAALLAVLTTSLPCVSGVNTRPVKPANRPNNFGVSYTFSRLDRCMHVHVHHIENQILALCW